MKKFLFTLTLAGALALGSQSASAAEAKTKPAESAEKPKAAGEKPKAAAEAGKKKTDLMPMNLRADEVDATAKTITQVIKGGTKSVNTVTAATEIKNGDKEAKFDEIKKGDWVAGSRKKTGENAYEVVKITKFGAKAEKAAEPKKAEGDAKKPATEGKKPDAPAKPATK